MRIRAPFVLIPLIGLLVACWWLLSGALAGLQPLRGSLGTVLRLALFCAPFYVLWRVANE